MWGGCLLKLAHFCLRLFKLSLTNITHFFCVSNVAEDKHFFQPSISQGRLHQERDQKHVLGQFLLGLWIFISHCWALEIISQCHKGLSKSFTKRVCYLISLFVTQRPWNYICVNIIFIVIFIEFERQLPGNVPLRANHFEKRSISALEPFVYFHSGWKLASKSIVSSLKAE